MKKTPVTLFLACSQPSSLIPHALFCSSQKAAKSLSSALEGLVPDEVLDQLRHTCENQEDELHDNHPINPRQLIGWTSAFHPKGLRGVYTISLELPNGKYSWVYTERPAFEADKALFEKLTGTVETFNL